VDRSRATREMAGFAATLHDLRRIAHRVAMVLLKHPRAAAD